MRNAVHGHADAQFDNVADALADELSTGAEVGAAIAIDIDGELVVDIWGGHADAAKTVPWAEDTIINVWSSTKTVTCLAALMLADRGVLDLDAPVATYWPEFAANGKQDVKVRHLLSHTSGVAGWQEPMTTDDLFDWEKATSLLAAQAPWWEPGTASGYQALNFGFLIGELVRRTVGKSLKDFVRDDIARPLDADFQFGARPDDYGRIAELIPPPPFDIPFDQLPEDNPMRKTLTNPAPEADIAHTAAWRDADLGAVNGHGNARSLARMLSPISLGGTANGVRAVVGADDRADLRRPIARTRSGVGRPARNGHRLRPFDTGGHTVPATRRDGLLLGRLGWLDGADEPGPPHHCHLCDEQDGTGHARQRAHRAVRPADLRGAFLTVACWLCGESSFHFWWLIFPLGGMVGGGVRAVAAANERRADAGSSATASSSRPRSPSPRPPVGHTPTRSRTGAS